MDMPTPCPKCMDIVEFNDMERLGDELICSECADQNRCEVCDCVDKEVSPTAYGHLCNTCLSECKEEDEEEVQEMPVFEIYATGSYTYTKRIKAATQEEAEEIFSQEDPEICYQCGSEGLSLDAISSELNVEEVEDEDDY